MPRPRKNENKELSLVIADLIKNNQDISDIGTIVGCLGKDSTKWLKELKKQCTSIDEFLELARQRADIALVAAAVEAAIGYDYYEEDRDYIKAIVSKDTIGNPILADKEIGKRIKKRHAKRNDALLKFLLKNRLPEFFQDVSKVEINKKSIEIKEITANEIKKFAGKLADIIQETDDGKTNGSSTV